MVNTVWYLDKNIIKCCWNNTLFGHLYITYGRKQSIATNLYFKNKFYAACCQQAILFAQINLLWSKPIESAQ